MEATMEAGRFVLRPTMKVRSVLHVGNWLYIAIPPNFARRHDIQKGDRLAAVAGKGIMKVVPCYKD